MGSRALLVKSRVFEYYLNPLFLNYELFIERSAVNILGLIEQQLKIIDCVAWFSAFLGIYIVLYMFPWFGQRLESEAKASERWSWTLL